MSQNKVSLDINGFEGEVLLELVREKLGVGQPPKNFGQVIPVTGLPPKEPQKSVTGRADYPQLLQGLKDKLERALSGESGSGVYFPKV